MRLKKNSLPQIEQGKHVGEFVNNRVFSTRIKMLTS